MTFNPPLRLRTAQVREAAASAKVEALVDRCKAAAAAGDVDTARAIHRAGAADYLAWLDAAVHTGDVWAELVGPEHAAAAIEMGVMMRRRAADIRAGETAVLDELFTTGEERS